MDGHHLFFEMSHMKKKRENRRLSSGFSRAQKDCVSRMKNAAVPQPGILPETPTLSVCMIVRDEEKALPRCLRSVQDVADELIVVDTGSQDNTVSVAKHFGAKVHDFEWRDDFAAARNEALKHAVGDWILQIDADEELLSGSIPHLKDHMSRPTVLYCMIRCDNGLGSQGPRFSWFGRLFRRHPELCYHRPYHEGVDPSVQDLIMAEPRWQKQHESNIVIRHYGFEQAEEELRKKCEIGRRIMKSYIKKNPRDFYVLAKLGDACGGLGLYEEAEDYLNKALEIAPAWPEANYSLGLTLQNQGKLGAAIRYYNKAVAADPEFAEAHGNLAIVLIERGLLDDAISELKRALAINPDLALGHSKLGLAYDDKGMLDEAISEYKRALAIDPGLGEAHNNLAVAYYTKKQYDLAIQHCDKAIQLGLKVHSEFLQELKAHR